MVRSEQSRRLNPYGSVRNPWVVDPRERELLTGMGNCYEACGEDFEHTVGMVAGSRKRTTEEVKQTLGSMAKRYGSDSDYQILRNRLPTAFPF